MNQRPYPGLGPQKYAQASKSSSQGQSGVTFEPSKKKGTIGLGEDNLDMEPKDSMSGDIWKKIKKSTRCIKIAKTPKPS